MAEIWALLIQEIADEPVLPFDIEAYAREVNGYVKQLKNDVEEKEKGNGRGNGDIAGERGWERENKLDLSALEEAAEGFTKNAADFKAWEHNWTLREMGIPEYNPMLEPRVLAIERISRNHRMSNFDTHLLDLPGPDAGRVGGIPGREQFKHVVFGPQLWSGYEEAYFPGIRDAFFEYGNVTLAQEWVGIVAGVLGHASWKLVN